MKHLIIIRHAKAMQGFGSDKERPLSERGHQDAEKMASRLLNDGYKIDMIFSSPAKRTKETTDYFVAANMLDSEKVKFFDKLYLGDTLAIVETIEWLKENVHTLAIIGHNPGVSNFVNDMAGVHIESLPTCGVAIMQIGINSWEDDFNTAPKKLLCVLKPNSD